LFAVVEAKDDKGGVYRSMDKGASWEKRSSVFTSGNYYQEVTCDPINVDRIFITDTYYKVSHDGGKTVSNLSLLLRSVAIEALASIRTSIRGGPAKAGTLAAMTVASATTAQLPRTRSILMIPSNINLLTIRCDSGQQTQP
jgi:hypothetical protein